MAFSPQEQEHPLFEQKVAEMVSPCGGKPTVRSAHFLKSCFPQTLFNSPSKSTPTKPISAILKFLPKVHFNGWRSTPLKNWNSWVEKMRVLHEQTWRKASIYDAIMASKLEIPKCYDSLFVLAEKWCPETSSFVMPWGEATMTLEDVMVLGCYSVTGVSVSTELSSKELLGIEEKLLVKRSLLMRTKHKKASQYKWMEMWKDNGIEIEHEAFLSLWLSRYVLPADDISTINKSVFPLAVFLAKGIKLALGPSVLASIYRDLRLFKEKIETLRGLGDHDFKDVPGLTLWAPLQLFQAWIWERFPNLSPKPSCITEGLRLERWNKVKVLKNDAAHEAVDLGAESFEWRPYSTPVNNWSFCPKLYPEMGVWVCASNVVGFDIESYVRCVRTSELVGLELGCVEQYFPHRVSMQFGLDQDIPLALPRLSDSKTVGWNDYSRPIIDVKLYVPSRLFESDVTIEYLKWWKKSKTKGSLKASASLTEMLRIKKEMNVADVPPGFDPKGKRVSLNDSSDSPCCKWSNGSPCPVRSRNKEDNASFHSTPEVKGVVAEKDSDDHLTLSQLFGSKSSKRANISTSWVIDLEGPLSFAGDSDSFQEVLNNAGDIGEIGCTRTGLTLQDRTEIDAGSSIQRQPGVGSIGVSSEMDLLDRIARLQRIVDMVKVAKTV